jgi:hypothetical protein
MSEQLDAVLGRLGYVRRDNATGQDLEHRHDTSAEIEPQAYPQVVMVQGHSTGESWVRDHTGQLLLAAGVGVVGLAALAVVALVAIATAVALAAMAASLAVIKGVTAAQAPTRRGWRR